MAIGAIPKEDENGNPYVPEYGFSLYRDYQKITIAEMPEMTVEVVENVFAAVTRTNMDGKLSVRDLRQCVNTSPWFCFCLLFTSPWFFFVKLTHLPFFVV